MLIKAKITWENNLQNRIFKFQEDWRQKFAASTPDKFITFLKAFFKYCVKRGYLDVNTYTQITFLKRKTSIKRIIFSDEDLRYCIGKGDLDFLNYMITLFLTGARPNEILKMTKNDINRNENTVTIWMNKTPFHKTTPINPKYLKALGQISKANGLDNGYIFTAL